MSQQIPFVTADDVCEVMPMSDAITTLREAFAAGIPHAPLRSSHQTNAGELLVMPSWGQGVGLGIKLVTINKENPTRALPTLHSVYLLFDGTTSAPRALIEGDMITGIRTAAVSGVATEALAAANARRLVVFGAGPQAGVTSKR